MSFLTYLRQLALLIRLPNSFTVISNVTAAYLIGSQGDIAVKSLSFLIIASLCFYHGGIVLNDCVDIKEDKLNQPNRPLASGAIKFGFALALVVYLLGFGVAITYTFGSDTFKLGVLLGASILAYNFAPREGLVGCLIMGACRGLNWLVVLSAVGALKEFAYYAAVISVYVMSLTFLSRDEEYAKRPWLAWLSVAGMGVAGVIFLAKLNPDTAWLMPKVLVFCAAMGVVFYKLSIVIRHYTSEQLRGAVKFFVIGLIPLDAILLLVSGYPIASILVLLLLIPTKFLARRLYVT